MVDNHTLVVLSLTIRIIRILIPPIMVHLIILLAVQAVPVDRELVLAVRVVEVVETRTAAILQEIAVLV
uniref:Uncharacterized protein n=1 Tax=Panstrongylus lignarius TaxID=156445 RepID=A0A224Y6A8_9HEMI